MINYGNHYIDDDDVKNVVKALKSKKITQGKYVTIFEKNLAKKFGAKKVSVLSSGTAGLHLCGRVLGWKKGDLILTTPISFVSTSNSILYSEANPVFIDIDLNTLNIDLNILEDQIKTFKKKNKPIKSVVAIDYAGNPCDWKNIKYLAKKYNFTTINDNCHSIGSEYNGTLKYAVKYADLVVHSYHAVKNITTGEGGAVLSNNIQLLEKIQKMKTHGLTYSNRNKMDNIFKFYDMKNLGFNYRLTDFQCALGNSQLKKLDMFLKRRREIANLYNKFFKDIENFIVPPSNKLSKHGYHIYPLQIKFDKFKISKNYFFSQMRKNNINLQCHYMPIYKHSYYKNKFGFNQKNFKNAEIFFKREVSLPIFYSLKNLHTNATGVW